LTGESAWVTGWELVDILLVGGVDDRGVLHFFLVDARESDTLTLIKGLHLPACSSGSANTWEQHHSRQLQTHGVLQAVILPDCDAPGEESAIRIAHHNLAWFLSTCPDARLRNVSETRCAAALSSRSSSSDSAM